MEDKIYDCVGNEAVITDCPKNFDSCSSVGDFVSRTALNCKGKKQLFVSCFKLQNNGTILFYQMNMFKLYKKK